MANPSERLELVLRRRLVDLAPGWAGNVSVQDDHAFLLELRHPYSEGWGFQSGPGLANDAVAAASWVERQLRSDEFTSQVRLFADAPEPTGDGYMIRTLRTFSELFEWSNREVLAVTGLLVDAGALSDAEHEWARRSLGHDARAD